MYGTVGIRTLDLLGVLPVIPSKLRGLETTKIIVIEDILFHFILLSCYWLEEISSKNPTTFSISFFHPSLVPRYHDVSSRCRRCFHVFGRNCDFCGRRSSAAGCVPWASQSASAGLAASLPRLHQWALSQCHQILWCQEETVNANTQVKQEEHEWSSERGSEKVKLEIINFSEFFCRKYWKN